MTIKPPLCLATITGVVHVDAFNIPLCTSEQASAKARAVLLQHNPKETKHMKFLAELN